MIKCRTILDKKSIKALANYHFRRQKSNPGKKLFLIFVVILLTIMSIINAYGIWMKYSGTVAPVIIILRASVFVLISVSLLYTSIYGPRQNLYRELKEYFKQTDTKHIDYVIDQHGIRMNIHRKTTTNEWSSIDHIESDKKYYYFSSNEKHSIISKDSLSQEQMLCIDNLIKEHV